MVEIKNAGKRDSAKNVEKSAKSTNVYTVLGHWPVIDWPVIQTVGRPGDVRPGAERPAPPRQLEDPRLTPRLGARREVDSRTPIGPIATDAARRSAAVRAGEEEFARGVFRLNQVVHDAPKRTRPVSDIRYPRLKANEKYWYFAKLESYKKISLYPIGLSIRSMIGTNSHFKVFQVQ